MGNKKNGIFTAQNLLASCKSGRYFMPVLKIVHRPPGSCDKVTHMTFLLCLSVKQSLKVAVHGRT